MSECGHHGCWRAHTTGSPKTWLADAKGRPLGVVVVLIGRCDFHERITDDIWQAILKQAAQQGITGRVVRKKSTSMWERQPIDLSGYETIDPLIRLPAPQVELGLDGKLRVGLVDWLCRRADAPKAAKLSSDGPVVDGIGCPTTVAT